MTFLDLPAQPSTPTRVILAHFSTSNPKASLNWKANTSVSFADVQANANIYCAFMDSCPVYSNFGIFQDLRLPKQPVAPKQDCTYLFQ